MPAPVLWPPSLKLDMHQRSSPTSTNLLVLFSLSLPSWPLLLLLTLILRQMERPSVSALLPDLSKYFRGWLECSHSQLACRSFGLVCSFLMAVNLFMPVSSWLWTMHIGSNNDFKHSFPSRLEGSGSLNRWAAIPCIRWSVRILAWCHSDYPCPHRPILHRTHSILCLTQSLTVGF